jgi:hypothetical protein
MSTARVSPFRFKKCFAYKRNKAKLGPCMCFACSLKKISTFSLLFASFRFQFFASLQLSYFRFERNEGKFFFAQKKQFFDRYWFIYSSWYIHKKIRQYKHIFIGWYSYTLIHIFSSQATYYFWVLCRLQWDWFLYTDIYIFKPIHTHYTHRYASTSIFLYAYTVIHDTYI